MPFNVFPVSRVKLKTVAVEWVRIEGRLLSRGRDVIVGYDQEHLMAIAR